MNLVLRKLHNAIELTRARLEGLITTERNLAELLGPSKAAAAKRLVHAARGLAGLNGHAGPAHRKYRKPVAGFAFRTHAGGPSTRERIYFALAKSDKPLTALELGAELALDRPAINGPLAFLYRHKLVARKGKGRVKQWIATAAGAKPSSAGNANNGKAVGKRGKGGRKTK